MKKCTFLTIAAVATMLMAGVVLTACEDDEVEKIYDEGTEQTNNEGTPEDTPEYVDLGLPSGIKWKNQNEFPGVYEFDYAVSKFGNQLPTKAQWEELKAECLWKWTGSGYKVTGPNGNSITLPDAGYRSCNGSTYRVGYWSSSPNGSSYAWYLYIDSGVGMGNSDRCREHSVRLIQK